MTTNLLKGLALLAAGASLLCAEVDLAELRAQADAGHTDALVELAHLSLNAAEGMEFDPEFIFTSFQKGCDAELASAHYGLAKCYVMGIHVDPSPEDAFKHASMSAELGDLEGVRYLGNCYYYGRGTPKDEERGIALIKEAIEKGSMMAEYTYAFILTRNLKDPASNNKGIALVEDLVARRHGYSAQLMGTLYHDGMAGLPNDRAEAMKYYRMAAEWGNADGFHGVGQMLLQDGKPNEAVPWLVKGINRGSSAATWTLAKVLRDDPKLQEYPHQWVDFAEKAAIRGNKFAQDHVAEFYYDKAPEEKRDWVKASKYLLMAAKQGRCHCWDHLAAIHYWAKHGIDQDIDLAIHYLRKHFMHEHRSAEILGVILTSEPQFTRDRDLCIKGYASFLTAIERGGTLPENHLEKTRTRLKLTEEEIARAKELSRDGFPSPGARIFKDD